MSLTDTLKSHAQELRDIYGTHSKTDGELDTLIAALDVAGITAAVDSEFNLKTLRDIKDTDVFGGKTFLTLERRWKLIGFRSDSETCWMLENPDGTVCRIGKYTTDISEADDDIQLCKDDKVAADCMAALVVDLN